MELSKDRKIGWKFPVGVIMKTGELAGTNLEEDIMQSIIILLNTRPGERLAHPGYGCDLLRFTFENIGSGLINEIITEITRAINIWEDRIDNLEVREISKEGNHGLIFQISYDIAEAGIRSGVLYEFSGNGQ